MEIIVPMTKWNMIFAVRMIIAATENEGKWVLRMNNVLELCPFCGRSPHLDRHEIFCDCGAKMQIDTFLYEPIEDGRFPTYDEAKTAMIDAWNERYTS